MLLFNAAANVLKVSNRPSKHFLGNAKWHKKTCTCRKNKCLKTTEWKIKKSDVVFGKCFYFIPPENNWKKFGFLIFFRGCEVRTLARNGLFFLCKAFCTKITASLGCPLVIALKIFCQNFNWKYSLRGTVMQII